MAEQIREVEYVRMGDNLYAVVNPWQLKAQDVNARFMDEATFRQLCENVKIDGRLDSVPLVHRDEDGALEIISGHHRVAAAKTVGLQSIVVMVLAGLTRDEITAKQLSHNELVGQDDPQTLKTLWDSIRDLQWKSYAGLDSNRFAGIDFSAIREARFDMKTITIAFLPEDAVEFKKFLEEFNVLKSTDETYVASLAHYEAFFGGLLELKDRYKVYNTAAAFMKIAEIVKEKLNADALESA